MKFFSIKKKNNDEKKSICEGEDGDQAIVSNGKDDHSNDFKSSILAFHEDGNREETPTEAAAGASETATSTTKEVNNGIVFRRKPERIGPFETVRIFDEDEMKIQKNAVPDFFRDEEIVHGVSINQSVYRYFLMFSGLMRWRVKHPFMLKAQRALIVLFIAGFLFIQFNNGLFVLSWIVLEKKFPFSLINQVIWELRWVVTHVLTYIMMANCGLQHFLKDVKITRKGWRENERSMRIYVAVVSLITVLAPTGFVILDLNTWNGSPEAIPLWQNFIMGCCMFFYRMLMVPSFCVLTVILKLLGDHIHLVGKRLHKQKTCRDAHDLVSNMRILIRKTEKSLQVILMAHMFLVFCTSFTTTMSTLERLELSYNSPGTGNGTRSEIKIRIDDQQQPALPLADFIQLEMNFQQMKTHFQNGSTGDNADKGMMTINAENLHKSYKLIMKVQQQQIELLQKLYNRSTGQHQNITIQQKQKAKLPNVLQVIGSISSSYKKMRLLLDMVMTLIEILLLYMSPLILVVRTDYCIRETIHEVWDINIEEQAENKFAINTYIVKEHILSHVKDTEGFRVCGYRIDFFKTLILVSFGPFIAIATRTTMKHYGCLLYTSPSPRDS